MGVGWVGVEELRAVSRAGGPGDGVDSCGGLHWRGFVIEFWAGGPWRVLRWQAFAAAAARVAHQAQDLHRVPELVLRFAEVPAAAISTRSELIIHTCPVLGATRAHLAHAAIEGLLPGSECLPSLKRRYYILKSNLSRLRMICVTRDTCAALISSTEGETRPRSAASMRLRTQMALEEAHHSSLR